MYKNIHQTPFNIETLTLFYTIKKDISLKSLIKVSTLLELITGKRSFFIRSQKSSIFLKIRKGAPSGVKVTLRKKSLQKFLTSFIWEVLPNIKDFKPTTNFFKLKQDFFNSVMFVVFDPLVFPKLQNFYFLFKSCVNLRMLVSFSSKITKKEIFFNGRFTQLPLS